LRYVQGEHNIVADALSRLDIATTTIATIDSEKQMSATEVAELFAMNEEDYPTKFPLSYQEIADRQVNDPEIQKLLKEQQEVYQKTDYAFGDNTHSLATTKGKI
jgi:hypothetical protein